jgi:hypothetical protein
MGKIDAGVCEMTGFSAALQLTARDMTPIFFLRVLQVIIGIE